MSDERKGFDEALDEVFDELGIVINGDEAIFVDILLKAMLIKELKIHNDHLYDLNAILESIDSGITRIEELLKYM